LGTPALPQRKSFIITTLLGNSIVLIRRHWRDRQIALWKIASKKVTYTVQARLVLFSSFHCKNGRLLGEAKAVLKTELSTESGSDKQWKTHAATNIFASNDNGTEEGNTLVSNELVHLKRLAVWLRYVKPPFLLSLPFVLNG